MSAQFKEKRRKNYFINKKFQTRFILEFCGLLLLGVFILGVILIFLLFTRNTVTTAFINSRLSIITTSDYVLPLLIKAGVISVILVGIATGITVKYLTHRIAGPLFNIERNLKQIATGDFSTKVDLRSTDEIKKLAENINEMTKGLNVRVSEAKERFEALEVVIQKVADKVRQDKNLSENIGEPVKELLDLEQKLRDILGALKTGDL